MAQNADLLLQLFITSRQSPDDVRKALLENGMSEDAVNRAYNEFRKLTGRRRWLTPPPPILVDSIDDEAGWYLGADRIQGARFWPALKAFLLTKWSPKDVELVDTASDKIVALLEPPYAAKIQTRGLAAGYVQSGKTANFTAVMAKAADAGYQFFIVLSGMKTNLRNQTHNRLFRELVALSSDSWYDIDKDTNFERVGNINYLLATTEKDHRVLCVVKKHGTVLAKLIQWLKDASPDLRDRCPFLIIDDEADEASVNTARNQATATPETTDRTAINRNIVSLLQLLPKSAYIGYTATPFANVFIDPRSVRDLYPRDFIVSLPKPAAHFGPERIFGRDRLVDEDTDDEFDGLDVIRKVPDSEIPFLRPANRNASFTPQVTKSLQSAIHYFWMATAARFARGQSDKFSTMLVHTAPTIRVHNMMSEAIRKYHNDVIARLRGPQRKTLLDAWEIEWDDELKKKIEGLEGEQPVPFSALLPHLDTVIQRTVEVTDNSQSRDRLSFDGPPRIQIGVGGNTLSRGLTLDGLLVSFFVRTATTYDTLLQMGRWFGYRPGYSDLPRIWMTSTLQSFFRELATTEAEMRQDIERYAREHITPAQYGVRIKTSALLEVTAALKMQHAVQAKVSFGGKHHQTVMFEHKDSKWLQKNIEATDRFITSLVNLGLVPDELRGQKIFFDVPGSEVLKFIGEYQFHPNMRSLQTQTLRQYIREQQGFDKLQRWNVVLRGFKGVGKQAREGLSFGGILVPMVDRARRTSPSEYAHIGALMSKGDVGADLRRSGKQLSGKDTEDLIAMRSQDLPDTGLLVIYPIRKDSQPTQAARDKGFRTELGAANDVIGLGFVFPEPAGPSRGAQDYLTVDPSKLVGNEDDWDDEDEDEAA